MENTQLMKEIQRAYTDYLSETKHLEDQRKPADGLLGFGRGLGTAPCHDQFSERLEQLLESLTADVPSSQDAEAVLRFIYDIINGSSLFLSGSNNVKASSGVRLIILSIFSLWVKLGSFCCICSNI
jgi:hypothetical protein